MSLPHGKIIGFKHGRDEINVYRSHHVLQHPIEIRFEIGGRDVPEAAIRMTEAEFLDFAASMFGAADITQEQRHLAYLKLGYDKLQA